jgi:hypothetical protein
MGVLTVVLTLAAFALTIANAITSRCPLWAAVLLVTLVLLIEHLPRVL